MTQPRSSQNSPWIFSPSMDLLFVLNFLWLIPLALLSLQFSFSTELLIITLLMVYPIIKDMHILSPILTILFNRKIRTSFSERMENRNLFLFLLIFPTVVMAVSWNIQWHELFGDIGSFLNPIGVLAVLYVLLSTWHISRQNYGLLAIYRRKISDKPDFRVKTDLYFSYGIFFVLSLVAFILNGERTGVFNSFVKDWKYSADHMRIGFLLLGLLLSLVCIAVDLKFQRFSLPRFLFILSSSLVPVLLFESYLLTYFAVVFMNHCLVAVSLGAKVASRNTEVQLKANHFKKWFLFLILAGVLLFQIGKANGYIFKLMDLKLYRLYGDSFSLKNTLVGLTVGFLYSINIIHFFADRFLFSMNQNSASSHFVRESLVANQKP